MLVYGSDVGGVNNSATKSVDKVFLWYARTILWVTSNTCNLITLGECGVLPPSIICHKQALCYHKRLHAMSDNSLLKKVFINLRILADMGFRTWITSVRELASKYDVSLDNELTEHVLKLECEKSLERTFISEWQNEINDINKFPCLRTYQIFKTKCQLEPNLYLFVSKNPKYRMAISKFRSSSHILEI